MTLWKNHSVLGISSFHNNDYFGNKVSWNGGTFYIVNVYSSFSLEAKRDLWAHLLDLKQRHNDEEWIFGGDFNAVKKKNESVGQALSSSNVE